MVFKAVCVLWVYCFSGSSTRCRLISVGMVTVAVIAVGMVTVAIIAVGMVTVAVLTAVA